jgi:hypothetical protein
MNLRFADFADQNVSSNAVAINTPFSKFEDTTAFFFPSLLVQTSS